MGLNPSSALRWGDYSLHLLGLLVRVLGWREKGIHSQGLGPETKRRKFAGPLLTRAATPTSHSQPRCSCPHSVPRGLLTTSAKKTGGGAQEPHRPRPDPEELHTHSICVGESQGCPGCPGGRGCAPTCPQLGRSLTRRITHPWVPVWVRTHSLPALPRLHLRLSLTCLIQKTGTHGR